MESYLGKRHFHDANPDSLEQDYQNTLFKLYGKEEGEDFEASLSGSSDTQVQSDVSVSDLPQGKPCGFLAPQLQLAYLDSVNHL